MRAVRDELVPRASLAESLGIVWRVLIPTLAKGVIIRRPWAVGLAERFDLDQRAVRYMQVLRERYQPGPLLFGPPQKRYALILSPNHVRRVLENTPEPFAAASSEKRAALSHFQPKGVLISQGQERADRRRFVEEVLDTHRAVHGLADRFVSVVDEEAAQLVANVDRHGELTWEMFAAAWFRVVRRVVFGDGARDDEELLHLLARLRSRANWAFLGRSRPQLRRQFLERVERHLRRAEPGSLAGLMAQIPKTSETAPSHQIPQWLFAFDPAGMVTFRALALLASHERQAETAIHEIAHHGFPSQHQELPFLRGCVLEAVRLWPTAPLVLRQSVRDTDWETGRMPAHTGIILFAPFFHRDDQRLPVAHRFAPEIWLENRAEESWPLIPFSLGPARCPGRNLVLLVTTAMLAALLSRRRFRLEPSTRLEANRPLPATLNNYSLRFALGS